MNLLTDIITYIRRIIKSPSNSQITDNLLIDYINRFWIIDVDARVQLFDLKTKYQFQTTPGVDKYNMPLYSVQTEPGNQTIGMFPVYQGFLAPCYINGVQVPFQTQKNQFFNIWPNVVQNLGVVATGNGTAGPYTIQIPILPGTTPPNPPLDGILRGHIDITGIIATNNNVDPPITDDTNAGARISSVPVTSVESQFFLTALGSDHANVVVADSGWFLDTNQNYGLLMEPGKAPLGNLRLTGDYDIFQNTVNYITGEVNVTFPSVIPSGNNISAQCFFFQSGLPRGILYYNNTLTLRSPPDTQYLVELDAYLSPAAFLGSGSAIPFGYMAEYIARGAAQKILSDTGDWEQHDRYLPLFKEQELLVWKRSQRQWTSSRTESIYSQGFGQGAGFNNNFGGGVSL
jgi:hypothetical protein